VASRRGRSRLRPARVGADGDLGPVIPVSEPSDKALNAAVALHRSGDATVAWVDLIGFEQSVLKVRRLPADGAPGPVSTLTPTLGQAQDVKLVVDRHDRTLAVWGQHGQLQAQRLSPAGDPLPGVIDVTPAAETSADVDVGIAANGEATVSWVRFGPPPLAVLTRMIAPDGELGATDEAASGADRPVGDRMAVNASGAAALVWFTSPPDPMAPDFAFGRAISPSGSLAPAATLVGTRRRGRHERNGHAGQQGAALAVWQRNVGATGIVEAAEFSAAKGPATRLSQPPKVCCSPTWPATARAKALAGWSQDTDGATGVKIPAARSAAARAPGTANVPPVVALGRCGDDDAGSLTLVAAAGALLGML
jgi:hypothetical protein